MWIVFSLGSAFFAALTGVLAKIGIRHTDSNLATAVRTGVVLVFSWLIILITGEARELLNPSGYASSLVWIILSGFCTGGSWLCYFKAIQLGDVNKVAPIDKSSVLITILAGFLLFGDPVSWSKAAGIALLTAGLAFAVMPEKKGEQPTEKGKLGWLFFAALSAVFAALSSILAKPGMEHLSSNTATALRTIIVLIMSWAVVFATGSKKGALREIPKRDMLFIILSGAATGASWLCYFRAVRDGQLSTVAVIDKLSLPLTVVLSVLVLKEKPTKRSAAAAAFMTLGALAMLI